MIKDESGRSIENVCNLVYLSDTMGGKKHLIRDIIDAFLLQVAEELQSIDEAIAKSDYQMIKNVTHTMKSSLSIMGISIVIPILQKMEDLGTMGEEMGKIKELSRRLHLICSKAIEELESAKHNYV